MNKFFPFLDDDVETVFSHVLVGFVPKAIGRGKIIAVVVQNPLIYADGTENVGVIFVGSGSNQIYSMIPGQESPPILAEDLKDVYVKLNFPFPNPNGGLLTANVATAGAGYTIGDVLTLTPTVGDPATVIVATLDGNVTAAAINAGGANYAPGDVVFLTGGGDGFARIVVDTVDGGGAILTFTLNQAGSGYTNGATVASTAFTGIGAGATFDVTASTGVATVTVTTLGTGFAVNSTYAATGGTGAEAVIRALTVDVITPETADVNLFIYRRRLGGKQ